MDKEGTRQMTFLAVILDASYHIKRMKLFYIRYDAVEWAKSNSKNNNVFHIYKLVRETGSGG